MLFVNYIVQIIFNAKKCANYFLHSKSELIEAEVVAEAETFKVIYTP